MTDYSTRQAAKKLGVSHAALVRYMAAGKIPSPKAIQFGKFRAHLWTEAEIEQVRKLLPKIANGRKTRYKRANSNSQLATGQTRPKSKTRSRGKSNSKKKKT